MITNTIDIGEVLWVLAALPGLWFWAANRIEAGLDARAANTIYPRNGRYLWARFSVFLTNVFIGVEVVFITLGVLAMLRPSPPDVGGPIGRLVTIVGLIGASAFITLLAYRWRLVNAEIVQAAREKHPPHDRDLPPSPDMPDEPRCDTGGHRLEECPRG